MISGEYLPTGDKDHDANLPGMGGVFNPINLDAYQYGGMNPVKYVDPDGKAILFETGGYYEYKAENRYLKVVATGYNYIKYVGPWVLSCVDKIAGVTRLESNYTKKIMGTSIDLATKTDKFNKLQLVKKYGSRIAKGATLLGLSMNIYETGRAISDDFYKAEFAIDRLNLLHGEDKEFLIYAAPYVEKKMEELIESGTVTIDISRMGYVESIGGNDRKSIDNLKEDIKMMKEAWDAAK